MGIGLFLYDQLAGQSMLPPARWLSADEVLRRDPAFRAGRPAGRDTSFPTARWMTTPSVCGWWTGHARPASRSMRTALLRPSRRMAPSPWQTAPPQARSCLEHLRARPSVCSKTAASARPTSLTSSGEVTSSSSDLPQAYLLWKCQASAGSFSCCLGRVRPLSGPLKCFGTLGSPIAIRN